MKRESVLIIEDEAAIREVLTYNLSREGFAVLTEGDGSGGLSRARESLPDLVILDLMLPGMDGIEVCRRLRNEAATRRIPILMLTAKSEESDVVLGLGVGADDYMAKPFSPRELIARVKAVLRRGPLREEAGSGEARVVRGKLIVDPGRHEVTYDGLPLHLTATELRLLHTLALHPGRVFTREQLINRAIGEDAYIIDRNIDVHIRSIRKKLGEQRDLIETVRSVGYRFVDTGGYSC